MQNTAAPNARAGSTSPDDLDNLFNYHNAVDDFLKDLPIGDNNVDNGHETGGTKRRADDDDLDKEIKEVKKRKPVPKLDEDRLLSDQGIPKLKKLAKTRVKFQSKGHEYNDISRLLNTYQLWLDDLYPRAKFRDALTIVEKVGHKKRMQVYRKAWIDESKPTRRELTPVGEASGKESEAAAAASGEGEAMRSGGTDAGGESGAVAVGADRPINVMDDAPEEDELDALLAGSERGETSNVQAQSKPPPQKANQNGDEPDEDELDALLGADVAQRQHAAEASDEPPMANRKGGPFEDSDSDQDELEALLDAKGGNTAGSGKASSNGGGRDGESKHNDDAFADEEEIMAEMGW